MKKKLLVTVLAAMMAASMMACGSSSDSSSSAATETAAATEEAAEDTAEEATEEVAEADFGDLVAEYEPTAGYDKYTLVDYTIEDLDAQFIATVSAKEDGSEYEVHCMFYGDEQVFVCDGDLNQISDKTGFMATDGPIIVQNAIDANNWAAIQ